MKILMVFAASMMSAALVLPTVTHAQPDSRSEVAALHCVERQG